MLTGVGEKCPSMSKTANDHTLFLSLGNMSLNFYSKISTYGVYLIAPNGVWMHVFSAFSNESR